MRVSFVCRRVCLVIISFIVPSRRTSDIEIHQQQGRTMADKQATIYVIDLGSSTGECRCGRVETDLDYGMRYIWDKIATTMSADRKSWNVGVIGFRTDETNGPLAADEGYENISVSVSLLWRDSDPYSSKASLPLNLLRS